MTESLEGLLVAYARAVDRYRAEDVAFSEAEAVSPFGLPDARRERVREAERAADVAYDALLTAIRRRDALDAEKYRALVYGVNRETKP